MAAQYSEKMLRTSPPFNTVQSGQMSRTRFWIGVVTVAALVIYLLQGSTPTQHVRWVVPGRVKGTYYKQAGNRVPMPIETMRAGVKNAGVKAVTADTSDTVWEGYPSLEKLFIL